MFSQETRTLYPFSHLSLYNALIHIFLKLYPQLLVSKSYCCCSKSQPDSLHEHFFMYTVYLFLLNWKAAKSLGWPLQTDYPQPLALCYWYFLVKRHLSVLKWIMWEASVDTRLRLQQMSKHGSGVSAELAAGLCAKAAFEFSCSDIIQTHK